MGHRLARGAAAEARPPEAAVGPGPRPREASSEGVAGAGKAAEEGGGVSEWWGTVFAVRLALLLLGLAALVPLWQLAAGCDNWVAFVCRDCVGNSASLALVAWCVWRRRRFHGLSLHAWTRWYAACALVGVLATSPMQLDCRTAVNGRSPMHVIVAEFVVVFSHWGLQVVQIYLAILKLDLLGRPRAARWARAGLGACLLCGVLFSVLIHFRLGVPARYLWGLVNGLFWASISGSAVVLVAIECGLLMAAQAARPGGRAGPRKERRWVRLTAVIFLCSWVSTIGYQVFLFYSSSSSSSLAIACIKLVDLLFNHATVLVLSGLVGPEKLRHLAEGAFRKINAYSQDQLQEFYEDFLAYLSEAQIKWVKCRYLRSLAASRATMTRCQAVPPAEAIIGSDGLPLARGDPKGRFVLSHPWLSKAHPDPQGAKLNALVEQLDILGASDEDAVFIDYMSLPQHDSQDPELQQLDVQNKWPKPGAHPAVRTAEEEVTFRKALGSMELIYSMSAVPVIVLPMDDQTEGGLSYIRRGWCLFEFCVAFSFGNIANETCHEPVKRCCDLVRDLNADTEEGFRQAFNDTHFTQSGDESVVLKLFANTISKKSK